MEEDKQPELIESKNDQPAPPVEEIAEEPTTEMIKGTEPASATDGDNALAAAYAALESDDLLADNKAEVDMETQAAVEEKMDDTPDEVCDEAPMEATKTEPKENKDKNPQDHQSEDEEDNKNTPRPQHSEGDNDHDEAEPPSRRHSFRTEALIKAAARVVVSEMERNNKRDSGGEHKEDETDLGDDSILSYTTNETEDQDDTIHPEDTEASTSRRASSSNSHRVPSSTAHSVADGAENSSHHASEDDVFSDHSPRSSVGSSSSNNIIDDDEEATTGKITAQGSSRSQSPYSARSSVRSCRVVSGMSISAASGISNLSHYDRATDFAPVSRGSHPRPAFRSPSSVRRMQMSSPTPSSPSRSSRGGGGGGGNNNRKTGLPTISRLGSPVVSAQFSPKGRATPPRFKQTQDAPLVLLHVTLLPLRWGYGDLLNQTESLDAISKDGVVDDSEQPSEGLKSLRGAWRQLQDRLGDTVLERGILLPHPQNDYEVLEERCLEALELPLRRRARILECGHYLGPSNEMTIEYDDEEDDDLSDDEAGSASGEKKHEKRHWCSTCRGDIKYEELGTDRPFRIKVFASNGLMKGGAWEACWKEMERIDIEVEPIVDPAVHADLAKLAAAFEEEQRRQMEEEHRHEMEEEERLRLEEDHRLQLEQERRDQLEVDRQALEAQRQQFEEDRRQHIEDQRLQLEKQRRQIEEEQRHHLEEARRQSLDEQHRQLEEQRLQLEEQRLQLEEERSQRLEEERRRLEREEEEQKQLSAPLPSFVEDEREPAPTTTGSLDHVDLDGRRRDSERMREIYGPSRASSDFNSNSTSNSTPSIHIHLDSNGRQQREDDNRLQQIRERIPTPRDSLDDDNSTLPSPESYIQPPTPTSPSEQAYGRRRSRRKSLQTASLPELLGETIRVLLHDPKNVAIIVLGVLIMMLAVRSAPQQQIAQTSRDVMAESDADILRSLHTGGQHQQQQQKQQLREPVPVGQVIMNTPSVQYTETVYATSSSTSPSQIVETVYKTVTESSATEVEAHSVSQIVETIYATVTPPSKVVQTIYKTVTAESGSESIIASADPCDQVVSRAPPSSSPENNEQRGSDIGKIKSKVKAGDNKKMKKGSETVRVYETVTETVVVSATSVIGVEGTEVPEIGVSEQTQGGVETRPVTAVEEPEASDSSGNGQKPLEIEMKPVQISKGQIAGVCVYGDCEEVSSD